MHCYYLTSRSPYLPTISSWLINTFQDNLDKVKLILPNSASCLFLQKHLACSLLESSAHFLLPEIIPLSSLWERFYVCNSDGKNFGRGDPTQELFLIAQNLDHNTKSADKLSFASKIHQTLREISQSSLEVSDQKLEASILEKSTHTQEQFNILQQQSSWLRGKLAENDLLPSYEFDNAILQSTLEEYAASNKALVFINIASPCKALQKFFKNAPPNTFFVLPPARSQEAEEFCLKYSLPCAQAITRSEDKFLDVEVFYQPCSEEPLATSCSPHNITFMQTEDEIEESCLIFLLVQDFLAKNASASIGIVTENKNLVNLIGNHLNLSQIAFTKLSGQSMVEDSLIQFLLHSFEYWLQQESLHKLFVLLKHPFLDNRHVRKLEVLVRQNDFVHKVADLEPLLSKHGDAELKAWWNEFESSLKKMQNSGAGLKGMKQILKFNLKLAAALNANIWKIHHEDKVLHTLHKLLNLSCDFANLELEEYPSFVRTFFKQNAALNINNEAKVYFTSEALGLNFDLVIIADCNHNSYHPFSASLLPKDVCSMLGLTNADHKLEQSSKNFYYALCNPEVIITRSTKVSNKVSAPARFLQKLLHLAQAGKIACTKDKKGYLTQLRILRQGGKTSNSIALASASGILFPSKVSATNVELLIKNPYGFYAKHLLKLLPLKQLQTNELASKFGTFVHKIIYLYNQLNLKDRSQEAFLELAQKELKELYNASIQNSWLPKICKIATRYHKFSQARLEKIKHIHSEVYGEMEIELGIGKQKIIAIADEILVTSSGEAYVVDYKTGQPPSKSDVLSGIAPQLLIEAMILAKGSFAGIGTYRASKMSFVKISLSEPYIEEIIVPNDELEQHYEALTQLLKHYVCQEALYPSCPNLSYAPRYNDYAHLARK